MKRKGIILAGGSGTRLYPLTLGLSKQLMPVYDKPMIYYPLSVLMMAGIREILIISTPRDLPMFEHLLGDGSQWGVSFSYRVQEKPEGLPQAFIIGESFLNGSPVAMVLGDNLFYGNKFRTSIKAAALEQESSTVFGYYVSNPQDYGVVEFDENGKVLSIEEKPEKPKSNYAVPGLYFYDANVCEYAKALKPSKRGELEITELSLKYAAIGKLDVTLLGRGNAWLDTGSHDSLLDAGNFVKVIEARQGLKIACLEEIAYEQQWISAAMVEKQAERLGASSYATYLRSLL